MRRDGVVGVCFCRRLRQRQRRRPPARNLVRRRLRLLVLEVEIRSLGGIRAEVQHGFVQRINGGTVPKVFQGGQQVARIRGFQRFPHRLCHVPADHRQGFLAADHRALASHKATFHVEHSVVGAIGDCSQMASNIRVPRVCHVQSFHSVLTRLTPKPDTSASSA